jgi:hypothetical protein
VTLRHLSLPAFLSRVKNLKYGDFILTEFLKDFRELFFIFNSKFGKYGNPL